MVRTWRVLATVVMGITFSATMAHADGPSPAAPSDSYVGAERCKMCHLAQYRHWRTTRMSNSWARAQGDTAADGACAQCHATGHGRPNGFRSAAESPNLLNVQCEVCHGPGSAHVALPVSNRDSETRRGTINRNRTECAACHESDLPHETPRTPQTRPTRFHVTDTSAARPVVGGAPAR